MKKRSWVWMSFLLLIFIGFGTFHLLDVDYAYIPPEEKLMDYEPNKRSSYDFWGEYITDKQAKVLSKTLEGREKLSPENGAVKIDKELLDLGRKTFYEETFGNEVFLTDILGMVNGPFTLGNVMKAIFALKGKGTNNLRVELAEDVTLGDKTYKKGEKVDTGIDVAKGAYVPIGLPVSVNDGRVRVGISCAACHASFDPETDKVVEGAPNSDLNGGLLLALSTNSASYFSHAEISNIKKYMQKNSRAIIDSKGEPASLPDPGKLEKAVDSILVKWPRGNFDTTIDLISNPIQIPDSFTLRDHPYSWSGMAMAGPFNGLSTFSNNVHSQNADATTMFQVSSELFGIDKEIYLGTILQKAANEDLRYKPTRGLKPSEFFKKIDPTPNSAGVLQAVELPSYPKVSIIAPSGVIANSPNYKFYQQNNGVSAWQNTLQPPKPKVRVEKETIASGRKVFEKAKCISCHAGEALTNNKIVPAETIKTEPSRAKSFSVVENLLTDPVIYTYDTAVPLPKNPKRIKVPTNNLDSEQVRLAFGLKGSSGGYKVPSLIGLYWTPPYLHDGGVAVGANPRTDIGVPGTISKGMFPDPKNSLRALIDSQLREKVIKANRNSADLQLMHVTGEGHEYWVDQTTGFSQEEQDQLISYLLSLYKIK